MRQIDFQADAVKSLSLQEVSLRSVEISKHLLPFLGKDLDNCNAWRRLFINDCIPFTLVEVLGFFGWSGLTKAVVASVFVGAGFAFLVVCLVVSGAIAPSIAFFILWFADCSSQN
jgi:hypothetical protein